MRKIIPLALLFLGACAADDPIDHADGGAITVDAPPTDAPAVTTYAVTWQCMSTECTTPLARADRAAIAGASIDWFANGDPAPLAHHDGGMSGACVSVADGADAGVARFAYQLCPVPLAPAPALSGDITWSASTWTATLTRI